MKERRDDYTSEVRHRKTNILYGITYMWNLKYETNELTYQPETDSNTENKLMDTAGWGGINHEFSLSDKN